MSAPGCDKLWLPHMPHMRRSGDLIFIDFPKQRHLSPHFKAVDKATGKKLKRRELKAELIANHA